LAGKLPIINPDDIARSIDPDHPSEPGPAMRAGREALARQKQYLADGLTFALETTFSGHRELALMHTAKAADYKLNLIFVCTESPMTSLGRIMQRIDEGEHYVPEKDVIRRYHRSLDNLPEGLKLADRAWLLDNTRERMRLVASVERGQVKSLSNSLPRWVRSARIPALEQEHGLSL
jgi:predicted ABC-type ATPase